MQSYTVHEQPQPAADRLDRAENLLFIKDGFSWGAALFTPIWLIMHRLWWALLGYGVLVVALQGISTVLSAGMGFDQRWLSLVGLAINLLVGLEAASLRRWALERQGWPTLGTVTGRTLAECERQFFDGWLPSQPIIAPPTGSAHLMPAPPARRGWPGFGGLMGSR